MIRMSGKGLLAYYLCLLLLLAGLLGNRHRDGVSRDYYNEPDYPELTNLTVSEEWREAWEAGTPYAGLVTQGPEVTLPAGSYTLSFRYRSEAAQGNSFEVASDTEIGADNRPGCVYAREELPLNDDGRFTASFTLAREAEHVRIRTYTEQGDLYVYGYTLQSTEPVNQDTWARMAALAAAFLLFRLCCIRRGHAAGGWLTVTDEERLWIAAAVTLTGLLASLPCLTDFVTRGHDLAYHLTRIDGLAEALRSGQFPARVNPEYANGYGQASCMMYPELFLYVPALLRLLGVSLILSWQMLCTGLNLACAWTGYFSFRRLFRSRTLGVLVSAFYTLSLYRLNNLYMRAALGEWIGMAFLPLVLYGMYALFYEKKERWGWSVLGFTLCLQGHLLITEMAVGFSALFALLHLRRLWQPDRRLFTVLKAAAVTVLLNLWYLIPLLRLYRLPLGITAEQQPLGQYALYPEQLFTTFLYNGNMGEYLGKTAGENPATVGGVLGIGILLYLYAAYGRKSLGRFARRTGSLMLGFAALGLYMSSYYFPWDLLQRIRLLDVLAGILQFPMRLLSVTSLFLSVVCALGVYGCLKGRLSGRSIAFAGLLLAIAGASYTLDSYVEENGTALADDMDSYDKNLVYNGLLYRQGTDMAALLARTPVVTASSEEVTLSDYARQGTTVEIRYENPSDQEAWLELPLYDYPGYAAWNDGRPVPVCDGDNHVVRVYVDAESSGRIRVAYRETGLFLLGDAVSAATLFGLAAGHVWKKRKKA